MTHGKVEGVGEVESILILVQESSCMGGACVCVSEPTSL